MSQDSSITDAINKTPVLTVFQPASTVGVARFGQWLASEGAILNTIDLGADQPVPAYSELNSDGIIILGGPMGANDGADYPWIEPLSQLVREAYAHAMPVFGICLGSQLSARALGGLALPPDRARAAWPVSSSPKPARKMRLLRKCSPKVTPLVPARM